MRDGAAPMGRAMFARIAASQNVLLLSRSIHGIDPDVKHQMARPAPRAAELRCAMRSRLAAIFRRTVSGLFAD
jgi:hypothetical protein